MIEFLTGLLAEFLGQTPEGMAALLYKKADDGETLTEELSETAEAEIKSLFAKHIESAQMTAEEIEAIKTKAHNNGHKAGRFEALSQNEKLLRETYGVEGKNIAEIVAAAIAKSVATTNDTDISEKMLTHPAFLALKSEIEAKATEYQSAVEALNEEWKGKLESAQRETSRKERFAANLPNIQSALSKAGVDLQTAPKQVMAKFLAEFESYDLVTEETGTYMQGLDGKKLKNPLGYAYRLEDFVSAAAKDWFVIQKQPARQSPGNEPEPPGPPNPSTKWNRENLPKNDSDFLSTWNSLPAGERNALTEAYENQKKTTDS